MPSFDINRITADNRAAIKAMVDDDVQLRELVAFVDDTELTKAVYLARTYLGINATPSLLLGSSSRLLLPSDGTTERDLINKLVDLLRYCEGKPNSAAITQAAPASPIDHSAPKYGANTSSSRDQILDTQEHFQAPTQRPASNEHIQNNRLEGEEKTLNGNTPALDQPLWRAVSPDYDELIQPLLRNRDRDTYLVRDFLAETSRQFKRFRVSNLNDLRSLEDLQNKLRIKIGFSALIDEKASPNEEPSSKELALDQPMSSLSFSREEQRHVDLVNRYYSSEGLIPAELTVRQILERIDYSAVEQLPHVYAPDVRDLKSFLDNLRTKLTGF